MVITVKIPKEHQSKLVKDPASSSSLFFPGHIPPEWIQSSYYTKALSPRPWSLFETLLTTIIQDILKAQLDKLISLFIADNDISENDYQETSNILTNGIQSTIIDLAKQAAEDAISILPTNAITTSWSMINLAARDYALIHSATRITRVNETTKEAVRGLIADWQVNGSGVDDLRNRLEALTDDTGVPLFGEIRARRIATTEVTNIYAGSYSIALQENGYIAPAIKPSLHVNCRCSLRGHIMDSGTRVIVWYTARDEMVCTRPIETNIGTVNGCRDMHKRIVSEGFTDQYI